MRCRKIALITVAAMTLANGYCHAAAESDVLKVAPAADQIQKVEDMEIIEGTGAPGLQVTPAETVIDINDFQTIGPQTSVIDVLKTQAVVDFRGTNDFDPGVDSIFLRGFDAKRFVTAIDGLTVQKTGGRKSSNIVDYSTLPSFLIKEVEVLTGPHSALYDSKSIGGVINMIMKEPTLKESLKPDITTTLGYSSYNTISSTTTAQGAVQNFTYDIAYQYYGTDGYLRNSETTTKNYYGRFGYILPSDGFITFSAAKTENDRLAPVNNPGKNGDYDSDYPYSEGGAFDPYMKPTWDGTSHNYSLNLKQPTSIGTIDFSSSVGKSNRKRAYYTTPTATTLTVMDTDWWSEGAKLQDEYSWSDKHTTTVGVDFARLYDDGIDNDKGERIRKTGAFIQHDWDILPSFSARLGLRYEDVNTWVTNNGAIAGREDIIERQFDQFIPKSFFTWNLDELASWLRDTSLSAGISKIWRAPDYHGDYNPQGRPAGAWLEPEHGMGYDLVLNRRLTKDISLKLNYSFYNIEDYIATNSSYAKYSGASAGALRYSDYKINLEEVYRHGIDVGLGGHLIDPLSFYLSYSWQRFENQGDEPAGQTELDQRAAHRIRAGLKYDLFANTALMLDYTYQSKETIAISEEIAEDVWDFREVENEAYHTVDVSISQKLFENKGFFRNAVVTVYLKNLFDEEYYDSIGFPATDRTFGTTLSLSF